MNSTDADAGQECDCEECHVCDIRGVSKPRPAADERTVSEVLAAADPHAKTHRAKKAKPAPAKGLFDDHPQGK